MYKNIFSLFDALDEDFFDIPTPEPRFPILRDFRNRLETLALPNESFLRPRMEISESEKEYTLKFDVPGIKKEDLKVTINKNMLEIKASTKQEAEEKAKDNRHYTERYYGSYYRSLEIPENIDKNSIKVTYTDGVLEIKVEKKELPSPEIKELPIG